MIIKLNHKRSIKLSDWSLGFYSYFYSILPNRSLSTTFENRGDFCNRGDFTSLGELIKLSSSAPICKTSSFSEVFLTIDSPTKKLSLSAGRFENIIVLVVKFIGSLNINDDARLRSCFNSVPPNDSSITCKNSLSWALCLNGTKFLYVSTV